MDLKSHLSRNAKLHAANIVVQMLCVILLYCSIVYSDFWELVWEGSGEPIGLFVSSTLILGGISIFLTWFGKFLISKVSDYKSIKLSSLLITILLILALLAAISKSWVDRSPLTPVRVDDLRLIELYDTRLGQRDSHSYTHIKGRIHNKLNKPLWNVTATISINHENGEIYERLSVILWHGELAPDQVRSFNTRIEVFNLPPNYTWNYTLTKANFYKNSRS